MKKVKNPRSDLSWSEITLVLIKKTIRLVLGSRVAEICSVFEGGLTDVIVVLLLLLFSSSPAPFPPPLASVPWVALSPGVAASAVAVCGFAWVVCLAQDVLHAKGMGECRRLRALWKAVSVAFPNVSPNYGSCAAPCSFLLPWYPCSDGFQWGLMRNWCSPKKERGNKLKSKSPKQTWWWGQVHLKKPNPS